MTIRKLIVNADDLGLSPAVNDGILAAHSQGVVTAATCLVGLEGWDDAVAKLAGHPDLDPGLHVNLTWGRPVHDAPLPRLAPGGKLRGKRGLAVALWLRRIPEAEIAAEVRAQLARFSDRLGTPTHVDVHQHLHVFPRVWAVVLDAVRDAGVPFLRIPGEEVDGGFLIKRAGRAFLRRPRPTPPPRATDHFRGLALPGRLDEGRLIDVVERLPTGLTELMVHPGEANGDVAHPDRLSDSRPRERAALTSQRVRDALARAGVSLTTFRAEAGGVSSPA